MLLSILSVADGVAHHIGSGFVTNKRGLFITAGHVIYNYQNQLDSLRVAFPMCETHCKLYKFKVLYNEYLDPRHLNGEGLKKIRPYHQDLTICRIMSYKTICRDLPFENTHFNIATKRPAVEELLTVKGFYNSGRLEITNDCVDLSNICKEDTQFAIKHRLIAVISREDSNYSVDPSTLDVKKRFNNCLTLRNSTHPGVSGGPVFNNKGEVVGCCLGGSSNLHYCNVMCSKYIRGRYRFIDESWH